MKPNYKIHKTKDPVWTDETGMTIPVNRVTKAERLAERKAGKAIKDALRLNEQLKVFKQYLKEASQEVYQAFLKENGATEKKDYKGNFTWYNFNRSIKIEINISEPIEFDDITISLAKEKFNEFLEKNITASNAFAKELVLNAFETRKGKLDTKRILGLTRYVSKVNDPLFTEAVELINKSIRRRPSREYYKIWVKDNAGQYQAVDLNFSSVKID